MNSEEITACLDSLTVIDGYDTTVRVVYLRAILSALRDAQADVERMNWLQDMLTTPVAALSFTSGSEGMDFRAELDKMMQKGEQHAD